MKIDGRCHCGYISYEAEIDPEKVIICHCTDCQILAGSAFRTAAFTREGTFKLLSGDPKISFRTQLTAGRRGPQHFAPNAERRFMGAPQETGRKSTPFVSAALAKEMSSSRRCSFGGARRSTGSVI